MAKRVLAMVAVVIVTICAYVGYTSYDSKRAGATGDVFSNDPPGARTRVDSETRVTAGVGAPSGVKAAETGDEPVKYAAASSSEGSTSTATQSAPGADSPAQVTQPGQPGQGGTAPEGDTISPNPPNGMAFSGKGRFQLYRQGNITWRLDTENGKSCILFATDDEWKRAKVNRAGCGSR